MLQIFKHWTHGDILCLILAVIPLGIIGGWMGDTFLSIASSITGILYVFLCAKGKLAAYAFGIVNCFLYAYLSYTVGLYGETLLNLCYYVPLQFIGFFTWRKQIDDAIGEVIPRQLGWGARLFLVVVIVIITTMLGFILHYTDGATPYFDAFTTVTSIVAMTLTAGRFMEQWLLWFAVNSVSIFLWLHRYLSGKEHIATLLMWVVFLVVGIYGFIKWQQRLHPKKDL